MHLGNPQHDLDVSPKSFLQPLCNSSLLFNAALYSGGDELFTTKHLFQIQHIGHSAAHASGKVLSHLAEDDNSAWQ